jgi:predicted nucleotide-binding protein (sugar kinase/HSP70/actin superfamily)
MLFKRSRAVKPASASHPFVGKKVWIPAMSYGSARAMAAVLHSLGIEAEITPRSNERTRELGSKFTCGDECYPLQVTLGDFLRILEQPDTDPKKTAFFMATANGPCRFGQYVTYMKSALAEQGYPDVSFLCPTDADSYGALGELSGTFVRSGWRALVAGDILLKLLLRTRPYEIERGSADETHEACVNDLCQVLEVPYAGAGEQMQALKASLLRARDRFRNLPARYNAERPLVAVVGEIFCRLNTFSNDHVVRRLEAHGAEAWMSDIAEWIWYTNNQLYRVLRREGRILSKAALQAALRSHFQKKDEHELVGLFKEDFRGYEEQEDASVLMRYAEPYLPPSGAIGEMVLNVGRAVYVARKGVDGIVDLSPFTCMNGIVSEAIYPRISADLGGIPIRVFYFDGTQSDLDRDIGIYVELARSYRVRKPFPRRYPECFSLPASGQSLSPQTAS